MDDATIATSEWAMVSGTGKRRYLMLQPRHRAPASLPVVIDLHGASITPPDYIRVTDARTLASEAIVIVPEAVTPFDVSGHLPPAASAIAKTLPPGTTWKVPGTPLPGDDTVRADGVDDIAFIGDLTKELVNRHGVDGTRIHLRGYSAGARLASHVAATIPDRIASVCCVAGVRFAHHPTPSMPPVLAIHGRRDHLNAFAGGSGGHWDESVDSAVGRWAKHQGCVTKTEAPIGEGVHEIRYSLADGSSPVRLIIVDDAQHSWPGTTDQRHIALFGAPGTFNTSAAHWGFVQNIG